MSDDEFKDWWALLKTHLKPHTQVSKWSAAKGYTTGPFEASPSPYVGEEYVQVEGADIYRRNISQGDFKAVLLRWNEYRDRVIPRSRIEAITKHSTYVISIIHWLEETRAETR